MGTEVSLRDEGSVKRTIEITITEGGIGIGEATVRPSITVSLGKTNGVVLPKCSLFGGFVFPDEEPAYGEDERFFYVNTQSGTYINFGGIQLGDDFRYMLYFVKDSGWAIFPLWISPNGLVNELSRYVPFESLYASLGFKYFDNEESYSIGDIVIYNSLLYRFTKEHKGAWDEEDVEKTNLAKILGI